MKNPDLDQNNHGTDTDQDPVSMRSGKFRHMRKIHAVPAGDQREREKDRSHNSKNPHGPVLSGVGLRLLHLPDLQSIFPEHLRMVIKPLDSGRIQRKNLTFFRLKKVIGIFLEILTEIRQLLIIGMQDQQTFADMHQLRGRVGDRML